MPKVTNKATGQKYTVDADTVKALKEHKILSRNYIYHETDEPDEVKNLKEGESAPKATPANTGTKKDK